MAYDDALEMSRQLHSDRPPLPDVPAVYFISPTSENIKRIAEVSTIHRISYQAYL